MAFNMWLIAAAVVSYLCGSINSSVLITKYIYHTDIRTQGSGNAGATNAARVFGMRAGVMTFLGDILKTIVPMVIFGNVLGSVGLAVSGMFCLIGHCWPVYFGFRGGKGVSTGAMLALMVDWRIFLILVATFFLVFALCRIVSASSITVAAMFPIAAWLLQAPRPEFVMALLGGLLVIFQHRANIGRLIRGEEKQFKAGGKKN